MKTLDLATGKLYDVVSNAGMVFPQLKYIESVSVNGKPCMNFLAQSGQLQIHNISYIATIMESERSTDESDRTREDPVQP